MKTIKNMRAPILREALLSLKSHAWFKRIYMRLSVEELRQCEAFIDTHGDMDNNDFELAVNRMFLDKPNKPKHWKEMQELVANANTIAMQSEEKLK